MFSTNFGPWRELEGPFLPSVPKAFHTDFGVRGGTSQGGILVAKVPRILAGSGSLWIASD